MSAFLQTCVLILAFAVCISVQQLGPVYVLEESARMSINNTADQRSRGLSTATPGEGHFTFFEPDNMYYEWESYDGWFNNPAHPEWGGAGKYLFV